ncbi:MAG: nuclease PIN [Candidatus Pristimantibacillus lignocellulolyticus]|uniref:Nuclease PIN n=1 Tax=Candidatus Pristimantibacillus lignocellulolyticus TaxID=2994561 RepID=A0A9J6ZFE5_9BACL|nr:MAG: nuclease PIN [Candidatus Pristimantibacillus lignocellulolyticus]
MHKQLRRYLILPLLLLIILVNAILQPQIALADVPYKTYYKDNYGQHYQIQAAYTPTAMIGSQLFIEVNGEEQYSPFVQPQDLFIDQDDQMYIADTNNNRIVHLNELGELVRILEFPDNPLNHPQGVFITDKGDIYIADTGNQRILKLNNEGTIVAEFSKPESPLIPDNFKYDPIKLVVDKRGFLYIATLGGYQGLLQLDPDGNFQGFFGANKTSFSVVDSIKRLLYSREMYEREISKLPGSITSVALDSNGFVYTVTKEVKRGQVKKLNIAGLDQLAGKSEYSNSDDASTFGEKIRSSGYGRGVTSQLNDLTVDKDGNITVIDSKLNVVSQYDSNGNLLFFWGGASQDTTRKLGNIKLPSAVANDSKNNLYILDSENNVIQKFSLSEFGEYVHSANSLTQDGRYVDSEPLWEEVNQLNAYYAPAVLGLAKAAYKKGEYEQAEQLFTSIGVAQGYSDSFWQNRLLWFQNQFGLFMNLIIVAVASLTLFRYIARKRQWKLQFQLADRSVLLQQLKHIFYIVRQPIDGFHAIRYEQKGSILSGTIVLVLAISSYAIMSSQIHFLFNPSVIVRAEVFTPIVQFVVIWLGYVISNYLISSLNQGEGRLRDVYIASSYAMFPFIMVGLPLTLISRTMTLNEEAIFMFLQYFLYGWVILLVFWKVQGIHNFSVGETIKTLILTIITMAILAILIFLIFSLSNELIHFVYSIYQEVAIR